MTTDILEILSHGVQWRRQDLVRGEVGWAPCTKLTEVGGYSKITSHGEGVWPSVTRCDKRGGGALKRYVTLSNFQPTHINLCHQFMPVLQSSQMTSAIVRLTLILLDQPTLP